MIDLHIHLDGSLYPEDILALAEQSGVTLPTRDPAQLKTLLSVPEDCTSLVEYLQKFDLPLQVLQTEDALRMAAYRVVSRLARQGLCYAEVRFAPQLHQQRGLSQLQVVQAAVEGMNQAVEEFHMPAQLILCLMRAKDNHRQNLETVEAAAAYLGRGVCCLDLAGDEAGNPCRYFTDLLLLAKSRNIPFILHAGEAAGAESVRDALRLGAVRIGHGVRSAEDPQLVERLARTHTPLEMCYTSNLHTKAAAQFASYPLKAYLDQGLTVTLNTDNMSVSDITLVEEYRRIQALYGLDEATLRQLAHNSAHAAFLPEKAKAALDERIDREFHTWLTRS